MLDPIVGVMTGGRDNWPTLAELERLVANGQRLGVTIWRHGNARGLDKTAAGYLKARDFKVNPWPADWTTHKRAPGPIRNRAMLAGDVPDLFGRRERHPADFLFAFKGGKGTADCVAAARVQGVETIHIRPVREPRIWNMHAKWKTDHPQPPGLIYVGRSREHGGPSPLANPFRLELLAGETRATAAPRILGMYRRWLWEQMQSGNRAVLGALDSIGASAWLGCTCWPAHCHVEIIVRAWRHTHGIAPDAYRLDQHEH